MQLLRMASTPMSAALLNESGGRASDKAVTVRPALPASGASAQNCLAGADGAPVRRLETVAYFGYQTHVVSSLADLGLAVTHNARTDMGKRYAGIGLSCACKSGSWAVGVVVSTPFFWLKSLNGAR
ncbi:MAG: hypothetical protein ING89_07565 [Rubrivivax sp.]|nr:hypothetical protein [Rubrivivax sp.]